MLECSVVTSLFPHFAPSAMIVAFSALASLGCAQPHVPKTALLGVPPVSVPSPTSSATSSRKPNLELLVCSSSLDVKPANCPETVRATRPLTVTEAVQFWDEPDLFDVRNRMVLEVEGVVTSTNRDQVPECALRISTTSDQPCSAPIPAVWIGDRADASPSESLQLTHFAPSFRAMIIANAYEGVSPNGDGYHDSVTGKYVESQFPVVGTRVRIRAQLVQSAEVPVADEPELDSHVALGVVKSESVTYVDPRTQFVLWPPTERTYTAEELWPFEDWAKASVLAQSECAGSSITVLPPWEAHFFSKERSTRVYPVSCSSSTPNMGSYTDEAGEVQEYVVSHNETNHIFLAYENDGERSLRPECTDGSGYESSFSCGSYWFVLPGAGKDLDLLLRFDEGCSDAGCDAELTVNGFTEDLELPPFPGRPDIVGGKLELVGREVHIDGQMSCTDAEWRTAQGPECSVPGRYVLSYDHGKLRIRLR